jgi:signal transduction histidine kinase
LGGADRPEAPDQTLPGSAQTGAATRVRTPAAVALPPELAQFVDSFNSTLERVEQAYSRLESFNADVAHELRSP